MVGVVIAAHGKLAEVLLETAEMIGGKQENVATVSFAAGQTPEELEEILLAAVDSVECGDGVLVLADLAGGSPYNAAALLACGGRRIEVVSGVNLAMLAEVLTLRSIQSGALAQIALESGYGGICRLQVPG